MPHSPSTKCAASSGLLRQHHRAIRRRRQSVNLGMSNAASRVSRHADPPATQRPPGDHWRRFRRLMLLMTAVALWHRRLAIWRMVQDGVPFHLHFMIAMGGGIMLALLLAGALMGLAFVSNRSGHDESRVRSRALHRRRMKKGASGCLPLAPFFDISERWWRQPGSISLRRQQRPCAAGHDARRSARASGSTAPAAPGCRFGRAVDAQRGRAGQTGDRAFVTLVFNRRPHLTTRRVAILRPAFTRFGRSRRSARSRALSRHRSTAALRPP